MIVRENIAHRLVKDTRGATAFIETVILIAVIAIFGLGAFQAIGSAISAKANDKAGAIQGLP
jgi:Flp pilus assembly pilin Flp